MGRYPTSNNHRHIEPTAVTDNEIIPASPPKDAQSARDFRSRGLYLSKPPGRLSPRSRLSDLIKVQPETYSWKPASYLADGGALYSGFIAQNVELAIPEAVSTSSLGFKQVSQMTILATVVNAVKELFQKFTDLATTVSSFAQSFTTHELCTTKSDGTKVCASGDQLAAILSGTTPASSQSSTAPAAPANHGNQAPVITFPGVNNPSRVQQNATYAFPTPQVTDDSDHNLGYSVAVTTAAATDTTTTHLDTSVLGTTTLTYTATDTAGAFGTSIFQIVVVSPDSLFAPAQAEVSTSSPANDNTPVATDTSSTQSIVSTTTAANDNQPIVPLAATGTNGTTTTP